MCNGTAQTAVQYYVTYGQPINCAPMNCSPQQQPIVVLFGNNQVQPTPYQQPYCQNNMNLFYMLLNFLMNMLNNMLPYMPQVQPNNAPQKTCHCHQHNTNVYDLSNISNYERCDLRHLDSIIYDKDQAIQKKEEEIQKAKQELENIEEQIKALGSCDCQGTSEKRKGLVEQKNVLTAKIEDLKYQQNQLINTRDAVIAAREDYFLEAVAGTNEVRFDFRGVNAYRN